jgi:hypothetical protein
MREKGVRGCPLERSKEEIHVSEPKQYRHLSEPGYGRPQTPFSTHCFCIIGEADKKIYEGWIDDKEKIILVNGIGREKS